MSWIFRISVLFTIGCLVGCSGKKHHVFEDYAFVYNGYSWDPVPYKFSTTIEDVVMKEEGSQMAATAYANIGAYGRVLTTWDIEGGKREPLTQTEIDEFHEYEAKKAHVEIIKRAQETTVTIINEAHHIPQHRVFTTSLLKDMWDIGYRHIGLEAYFSSTKGDSSLVANGYPTLVSGYYVKEPQLGNLIRQALKLGFSVFGYESDGHNGSK